VFLRITEGAQQLLIHQGVCQGAATDEAWQYSTQYACTSCIYATYQLGSQSYGGTVNESSSIFKS